MMNTFHDNIKFKINSKTHFIEEDIDTYIDCNREYIIYDPVDHLKGNINSKSNYLLDAIAITENNYRYLKYITLAKWGKRRHFYDKIKYINPYVGETKINYAHEFEIEYDRHALDFYDKIVPMKETINTSNSACTVDFKRGIIGLRRPVL